MRHAVRVALRVASCALVTAHYCRAHVTAHNSARLGACARVTAYYALTHLLPHQVREASSAKASAATAATMGEARG